MLEKPVHGSPHGCTDQRKPETHTEKQLSRVYDMLYAAEQAGLQAQKIFNSLPDSMKLEFNYSNWRYRDDN